MKQHNPLIWGVVSIVMGLLIMIYPDNTLTIMLRIIGVALLCVGAIQLVAFFGSSPRQGIQWSRTPMGGVLALVLGIMLAVSPETFVSFFMILIGLIIICLALFQIFSFVAISKSGIKVKGWLYAMPSLMFLSGFVFFFFPNTSAAWIVIFAGSWIVAYGVWEIIGYFATYKALKK